MARKKRTKRTNPAQMAKTAIAYQKDVAVPLRAAPGPGRPAIYPLRVMPVGASFWVAKEHAIYVRNRAAALRRQQRGWNYMTRIENDGIRLWRLA